MSNHCSLDIEELESKIRQSEWWARAAMTVDSHYHNNSGVMLTDHLEAVRQNVETIFSIPEVGFYAKLFAILRKLKLSKAQLREELKIVSLLHDIGKTREDKSEIIPHPLTGKAAHLRHGIVGLMAAMEIIGKDMTLFPQQQVSIYRTVELHDISFGWYREFLSKGALPTIEQMLHVSNKIHLYPGAGFIYLLLFKLADTHGHGNVEDVIWFFNLLNERFFSTIQIDLPIPGENDIINNFNDV